MPVVRRADPFRAALLVELLPARCRCGRPRGGRGRPGRRPRQVLAALDRAGARLGGDPRHPLRRRPRRGVWPGSLRRPPPRSTPRAARPTLLRRGASRGGSARSTPTHPSTSSPGAARSAWAGLPSRWSPCRATRPATSRSAARGHALLGRPALRRLGRPHRPPRRRPRDAARLGRRACSTASGPRRSSTRGTASNHARRASSRPTRSSRRCAPA